MTIEMGKRFEEALAEVELSADMFRVKDEDEAVALANDSDYGQGGTIITEDVARGQRLASRIETGLHREHHR